MLIDLFGRMHLIACEAIEKKDEINRQRKSEKMKQSYEMSTVLKINL